MDEILGEAPFVTHPPAAAESATPEVAGEDAGRRIDAWETELGEVPWAAGKPASGRSPAAGTATCIDRTDGNEPWNLGRPGRHQTAGGVVDEEPRVSSADVRVAHLRDFDVDDYRLRPEHRTFLAAVMDDIARGLAAGRVVAPVSIQVIAQTSSTASMQHNLALSRHRAYNTKQHIDCLAEARGISGSLQVKYAGVGESVSRITDGDAVEASRRRSVRVQVVAPHATACTCPPGTGAATRREVPQQTSEATHPSTPGRWPRPVQGGPPDGRGGPGAAALCVSVRSIRSRAVPSPLLRGLPPSSRVVAQLRVHDHRTRSVATYALVGVALPPALLRGSLRGPLSRLTRVARKVLVLALSGPRESRRCRPVRVPSVGADPVGRLSGAAVLAVPPSGTGRPVLFLRPRSRRIRLARGLFAVSAPRSARALVVVGRVRLLSVDGRPVRGSRLVAGEDEFTEFTEFTGESLGGSGGGFAPELKAEVSESGHGEDESAGEWVASEQGWGELTEDEFEGEFAESAEFREDESGGELTGFTEFGAFNDLTESTEFSGPDPFPGGQHELELFEDELFEDELAEDELAGLV